MIESNKINQYNNIYPYQRLHSEYKNNYFIYTTNNYYKNLHEK